MSEALNQEPIPTSYGEVLSMLGGVVRTYTTWEEVDEFTEEGITSFDGTIRPFYLPDELTKSLGLGSLVRSRVIGSAEEGMGVALIVRSMNPFNKTVQGFFIQPTRYEADGPGLYDLARGYEVWQGPARWPKRNGVYWGRDLMTDSAHPADTSTTETLISTIQKHAAHKTTVSHI